MKKIRLLSMCGGLLASLAVTSVGATETQDQRDAAGLFQLLGGQQCKAPNLARGVQRKPTHDLGVLFGNGGGSLGKAKSQAPSGQTGKSDAKAGSGQGGQATAKPATYETKLTATGAHDTTLVTPTRQNGGNIHPSLRKVGDQGRQWRLWLQGAAQRR